MNATDKELNLTDTETVSREYEIGALVVSEEDHDALVSFLGKHNAKITADLPVKRVALAYKIKKETSAVFCSIQFLASPAEIKSMGHELQLMPQVLRSLIITLPKESLRNSKTARRGRPMPPSGAQPAGTENKPAAEILSNEDLEKKIEEILS